MVAGSRSTPSSVGWMAIDAPDPAQQHVVHAELDGLRVQAEREGQAGLRVEVDEQHLAALLGQGGAQRRHGGRLGDPALLVRHGDGPAHSRHCACPAPLPVSRSAPVAFRTMSTPPFLELPAGVRATRLPHPAWRAGRALGRAGPRRRGAPVLLVPGYTGSKEDFIAVLAPIAAAGHPVVALDQRGQFEIAGRRRPLVVRRRGAGRRRPRGARRRSGAPVHLVGHSFGGLVSRAAALADPAALRSLTLMSSGPAAIPAPANQTIALLAQVLPAMDLETIWVAKRQIEAQTETDPPAARDRGVAARPVRRQPPGRDAADRRAAAHRDRPHRRAAPPSACRCSSPSATGTTSGRRRCRRRWPSGSVRRVAAWPGVGHSPAADAPDRRSPTCSRSGPRTESPS